MFVILLSGFLLVHHLLFFLLPVHDSSKVGRRFYFGKLIIPFIFALQFIAQQAVERSICPCVTAGNLDGCQERGRAANCY